MTGLPRLVVASANPDKVAEIAAAMLTLDTGDVKTKLAARLNRQLGKWLKGTNAPMPRPPLSN